MSILGLSPIPTLVITALAVFRLAYLITKESGPMFVFLRIRKAAKKDGGSLAEGVDCPYCVGMWCAIAVTIYLLLPWQNIICSTIIMILAVAGLAMLLHQVFTKLQK